MSTMFFKSSLVHTHWDTWMYFYKDTFYLYYLAEENGCWRGFGVATSKDGVTYEDHGLVLKASSKMVNYLGTGSIYKNNIDGGFIVNYSEWQEVNGFVQQRIFFAKTNDLINFTKCDVVFDIDENLYKRKGRWDCIYTIPNNDGTYFGTFTGTPKNREDINGGIAFGYSKDGIHWKAIESKGIYPDADESGAIVKVNDKFYGMFGILKEGMIGYISENVNGPYYRCTKNTFVLPPDTTYFARFFNFKDEILVNHHAITKFKKENGFFICYMAPLKKAIFYDDYISLVYWHGNDILKSKGVLKKSNFDKMANFFIEGDIEINQILKINEINISIKNDQIVFNEGDYEKIVKYSERNIKVIDKNCNLKILLKDSIFEIYINETYIYSYSMNKCFDGSLDCSNLNIYEIHDY